MRSPTTSSRIISRPETGCPKTNYPATSGLMTGPRAISLVTDRPGKLSHGNAFSIEKLFYNKAGNKPRNHLQKTSLHITCATKEMAKKIPYYIARLEPVRQLRHPSAHMLLVNVILVLQIPDRLPQLFHGSDLGHDVYFKIIMMLFKDLSDQHIGEGGF